MLRTLGQELDLQGVTADAIDEVEDSFRVKGVGPQGPYFRFYSRDELRRRSEERRALRQSSTTPVPTT